MTGGVLGEGNAEEALHIEMARDELLYQAARILERPRSLADLVSELAERVGRQVSETELILWLTLGAAARVEAL